MAIIQQFNYNIKVITHLIQKNLDRVILFIFPLLFTSINSNWIFTPPTNNMPDPWFYFAYFRYFFSYAPRYPSNIHYFVERLTWNVPGYYIYNVFPPLAANYILHLTVYYVGVFSLYGTLALLLNRRAAFISALLMGSYPWFLRAAGWDYTDGVGVSHFLLLVFLLTLTFHTRHWKVVFLLAGISHASLLITNPFWIGFFPSWGAYFLLLNNENKRFGLRQRMLIAAYFLLGNLAIVVSCGLFYYWVTGNYFFLEKSIGTSIYLVANSDNNSMVVKNYGDFIPSWHVFPSIVLIISTWSFLTSKFKRDRIDPAFLPSYLILILGYAWLIFWHYFSNPLLIMFPYSSFIIPATFLLAGVIIANPLSKITEMQYKSIAIATAGTLLIPATMLNIFPDVENMQGSSVLILILALILLSSLAVSLRKSIIVATGLLTCSIIFYLTAENSFVYLADRSRGLDNFKAVISASQAIDAYYPNHDYKDFRLWFRADENYNTFFSLAAVYLYPWGSAMDDPVSSKKPHGTLALSSRDRVQPGDRIVIMSSNANINELLEEATRALSSQHLNIALEKSEVINNGNIRFYLYYTKATASNSR